LYAKTLFSVTLLLLDTAIYAQTARIPRRF
jgi:hypothetical protein